MKVRKSTRRDELGGDAARGKLIRLSNACTALARANPGNKKLQELAELAWRGVDETKDLPLLPVVSDPQLYAIEIMLWRRYRDAYNSVEEHGKAADPDSIRPRFAKNIASSVAQHNEELERIAKKAPAKALDVGLQAVEASAKAALGRPAALVVIGVLIALALAARRD